MSDDAERGSVGAAASPVQQYGATEPVGDKDQKSASVDKLPLLLGLWEVSPSKLYSIGLAVYVAWFVVQRLGDIGYILTCDARFPPGLGHHYPSEEERLASVSYTRQVLTCRMLHSICKFCAVMMFVWFGLFARFDASLRVYITRAASWWEDSKLREWCNGGYNCCCGPMVRCCGAAAAGRLLAAPCGWCSRFKHRALNGRLALELCNLSSLTSREILIGSVYLVLIGGLFYVISAPFVFWSGMIDLQFGFSNPLTESAASIQKTLFWGFVLIPFGIPAKFLFLAVLQHRLGWLAMWSLLMVVLIYAQYNIKDIAPSILDMNNAFPNEDFAVGRNFPWVSTSSKKSPWISLNRIYFKDPTIGSSAVRFSTNDKSKGELTLTQHSDGKWAISDHSVLWNAAAPQYAQTVSAVAGQFVDGLKSKSWTVNSGGFHPAGDTRVGVRSGSHLRDELYGFARKRGIGISQIYMVDGSHKDIRANAFVAGAGNASVIGLFDTLFLGRRNAARDDSAVSMSMMHLISGEADMQHASEIVQGVDTDEDEEQDHDAPRNSAPTQAMGDAEVISVLAHELGHAAMFHLEKGMVVQAITSFMTFAAMGWMAHSPLAAVSLSLHAPLVHVGACAYEYVVGPPLEGIIKLFTDAHTRYNEYEADAYAALISEKYATALQSGLAKLSVNSNQDPDAPYFYELLHFDHPSFSRRWAHIEAVKKEAWQAGPPVPQPPL